MEQTKDVKTEEMKSEGAQPDPLQAMTELAQRTQANFENYRKQTDKRVEEIRETAAKNIILHLLPIIDNFELALKNVPEQSDFAKGIELIYSQLFTLLEGRGVEVINTEKATFDPYYHEALLKVESDLPANTILEEFQKGYLFKGQVLRHAKVKISAGTKNKSESHSQQQPKTNPTEEKK